MSREPFQFDVKIYGTVYVRAATEAEARERARKLKGDLLELEPGLAGDVEISGKQFDDPELPDVSLSPAMTIDGLEGDDPAPDVLASLQEMLDAFVPTLKAGFRLTQAQGGAVNNARAAIAKAKGGAA
jgi:hypothetical protein